MKRSTCLYATKDRLKFVNEILTKVFLKIFHFCSQISHTIKSLIRLDVNDKCAEHPVQYLSRKLSLHMYLLDYSNVENRLIFKTRLNTVIQSIQNEQL